MTLYHCLAKRIRKTAITFVKTAPLISSQRGLPQYYFETSFSVSHLFRIRNFIWKISFDFFFYMHNNSMAKGKA